MTISPGGRTTELDNAVPEVLRKSTRASPRSEKNPLRLCRKEAVLVHLPKGGRLVGKKERKHLELKLLVGQVPIPVQIFGDLKSLDLSREKDLVGTLEIFTTTGEKPRKTSIRFTLPSAPTTVAARLINHPRRREARSPGWLSSTYVEKGQLELAEM